MPWVLTAQKPSIRHFRSVKSAVREATCKRRKRETIQRSSIRAHLSAGILMKGMLRGEMLARSRLAGIFLGATIDWRVQSCALSDDANAGSKLELTEERRAWPSQCKHIDCLRLSFSFSLSRSLCLCLDVWFTRMTHKHACAWTQAFANASCSKSPRKNWKTLGKTWGKSDYFEIDDRPVAIICEIWVECHINIERHQRSQEERNCTRGESKSETKYFLR